MDLFASIHPVISKIEAKGGNRYLVFETIRMGPLPVSFTYPVVIRHDISKYFVYMQAVIFTLTTVEVSFNLSAENGVTTIEENIHVKSLPLLNSMTMGVIKTQHSVLFENIAIHLRQ